MYYSIEHALIDINDIHKSTYHFFDKGIIGFKSINFNSFNNITQASI